MDPRDQLRAIPDGMDCTVCDEPVPSGRIHLLARRDDLCFVQVECVRCGSTALEFLGDSWIAARSAGSPQPTTDDTARTAAPISPDEVLAMHEFLADWRGDARSLVEAGEHEPGSIRDGPAE